MKAALLLATMLIASPATAQQIDPKVQARIDRILKTTPLIDGHNDTAEQLREHHGLSVEGLASGTDRWTPPMMTDMARLRQGHVGGQFWSVYIPRREFFSLGGKRPLINYANAGARWLHNTYPA